MRACIRYTTIAYMNLVSHGRTLLSRRGVITCSISAPREKALILQAITPLRDNRVWPRETNMNHSLVYTVWRKCLTEMNLTNQSSIVKISPSICYK